MVKLAILLAAAAAASSQASVPFQDRPVGFASLEGEGGKRLPGGTTGGAAGRTVTVTTQADLEKYAKDPEPFVILVEGTLEIQPKGKEIAVASHKTIQGLGGDATLSKGGFFLGPGVHNVILRNLTIRDTYVEGDYDGKTQDFDGVQMDSAHHVWIDHCHFDRLGDGMIDSRKDSDYITISWNRFTNHNKVLGIGWTENMVSRLTIHHNWFQKVNQRNPSCDNAYCHMFNNYLEDAASYGHYSRGRASMVVENSVFRNVKDPWYHDAGARLTARGNLTEGSISGKRTATGDAFNPKQFYDYSLDPAEQVKALLAAGAGPRASIGGPTGTAERIAAGRPGAERILPLGEGLVEMLLPEAGAYAVTVSAPDGRVLERLTGNGPDRRRWRVPAPGVHIIHLRQSGETGSGRRFRITGW